MKFLRSRAALGAVLALSAALLGACDSGKNPFNPPKGGPGGGDSTVVADTLRPTVTVSVPGAPSGTVNLGDSVLVRARVRDTGALASLTLAGFIVRGDPALGTAVTVQRYETKSVPLDAQGYMVKDTTIDRYLVATADTARESGVVIVATATDTAGNVAVDTARITIGGPSAAPVVDIVAPAAGAEVAVGDELTVRARVSDDRRLARVRIEAFSRRGNPAAGTDTVVQRYEARDVDLLNTGGAVVDTVVERTLTATRDTLRESNVFVVVTATDTSGYTRADTSLIRLGGPGAAPRVDIVAPAAGAELNVGDELTVRARAQDDRRLASVKFEAFSVRGSAAAGTQTLVPRYEAREVSLMGAGTVTDTVVERTLVATRDTARESGVLVVVTATDTLGYTRADTTLLRLGGPGAAPRVEIERPNDRTSTIAVGEELFIRAAVRDDRRLARVEFSGFAVRGDPALGTAQVVQRFQTKTVDLLAGGRTVTDTVLDRFLVATADTVRETGVYVVVTAIDTAGLATSDTSRVAIGGPRVQVSVVPGDEPRGGRTLRLQVRADDARDLLASVRVRGSGAFAFDRTLSFTALRASIDTIIEVPIPLLQADASLQVDASTVSGTNQLGEATPLTILVRAAEVDRVAPRTTFQAPTSARVEQADSFSVTVTGADENRVDSVGVTVLAIRRDQGRSDTIRVYRGAGPVTTGTFWFRISDLGIDPLTTAQVDMEVTAWAKDPSGNCGAAVSPNTPQQQPCLMGPGGVVLTSFSGRVVPVFVARGGTVLRPSNGADVVADLVADNRYVYLSNYSRNRVEVLPLGATAYGPSVPVGSEPWGLALGRNRDSLYVANSGGTNISVIPLGGSVLQEARDRRIFTRNERLYSVVLSAEGAVTSVTLEDYSDRPQFLAQASNGLLVYSTRPTPAAEDGTVRIYDQRKLRSEIFTGYVDRHTPNVALVVNADSAFRLGLTLIRVCPRRRFGDTTDPACIDGEAFTVADSLTTLRRLAPNPQGGKYDTRLDIGADVAEVGFADTTFVATSTDRRYVAVGEGARENARIPMFEALGDSLVLRGDVRDLISNSADRVIGLGINGDGSLSVARGNEAYFFTPDLRRQGSLPVGSPSGGVAMHPASTGYPSGEGLAFVSGIENGAAFIDILDAFHFRRIKRVFTRDPVVGALIVAPRAPTDPANVNLRLYALTSAGVLALPLTNEDLAGN